MRAVQVRQRRLGAMLTAGSTAKIARGPIRIPNIMPIFAHKKPSTLS